MQTTAKSVPAGVNFIVNRTGEQLVSTGQIEMPLNCKSRCLVAETTAGAITYIQLRTPVTIVSTKPKELA